MSGRRDDVGMDHFETPIPMSDGRRNVRKINTYDIEDINPLENFVDQNIDEQRDQVGVVTLETKSDLQFTISDDDASLDLQNGNLNPGQHKRHIQKHQSTRDLINQQSQSVPHHNHNNTQEIKSKSQQNFKDFALASRQHLNQQKAQQQNAGNAGNAMDQKNGAQTVGGQNYRRYMLDTEIKPLPSIQSIRRRDKVSMTTLQRADQRVNRSQDDMFDNSIDAAL